MKSAERSNAGRWVITLLIAGTCLPAFAAKSPRCALLVGSKGNLSTSPVAALLEAELLAGDVTMVERQAVDQVLKEQELSTLLGADAVGSRVKLGQVLKADVLIFLSADERVAGEANLVVCETASGIRTLVRSVSLKGDAEKTAATLATFALAAARKQGAATSELCAVPTFVSRDLVYDHDAMKTAYATLAGQAVNRLGLWTVELAEARALERELQLAGQAGQKLNRPLPLYLLGTYRHDGIGDARRVELDLTLRQGEREINRKKRGDIKPDDVATAMTQLVGELLAGRAATRPAVDAAATAAELKQLLARAAEFERTGDWLDAANLYETSLLLDPRNHKVRKSLISALRQPSRRAGTFRDGEKRYQETLEIHARERRLYHHIEILARELTIDPKKDWEWIQFETYNVEGNGGERDRRVEKLMQETRRIGRDIVIGLIRHRLTTGKQDGLLEVLSSHGQVHWQLEGETLAQGYDRLFNVVSEMGHLPDAQKLAYHFTQSWRGIVYYDQKKRPILSATGPEVAAYLERLIQSKSEGLRNAGQEMKALREAAIAANVQPEAARQLPWPEPPKATPTTQPTARLQEFTFDFEPARPKDARSAPVLWDWTTLAPGVDLLLGYHEVFLMKRPGVAKAVWSHSGDRTYVSVERYCYDGRFIWITGRSKVGRLTVIDPISEKFWDFTAADGLLPHNSEVAVVPIAPGRICMIGGFQPTEVTTLQGRGWCAIATFDPSAGKSFKVFHEAKTVIPEETKEKQVPIDGAFTPSYARVIGRGADQRIIVGRHVAPTNHWRCYAPPLIIDPNTLKISLWSQAPGKALPGKGNGPWQPVSVELDGELYFSEPPFVEGRIPGKVWQPSVYRATAPDVRLTPIGRLPNIDYKATGEPTDAAVLDGQIYLAGKSLYTVNPKTGECRVLPHVYPDGTTECDTLGVSAHYGLITWRMGTPAENYRRHYYQIELP